MKLLLNLLHSTVVVNFLCRVRIFYRKHRCDGYYSPFLQAYIKIYQGEELPHPKSMLQVSCTLQSRDCN